MVPAWADNHPRSSKENHPNTSPVRLTAAYLRGLIYGLTPFRAIFTRGNGNAVRVIMSDAQDRAPVEPCEAFTSPDAHSLSQHANHLESLFRVNAQIVQRAGRNITECLAALPTDEPLISLAVDSEFDR